MHERMDRSSINFPWTKWISEIIEWKPVSSRRTILLFAPMHWKALQLARRIKNASPGNPPVCKWWWLISFLRAFGMSRRCQNIGCSSPRVFWFRQPNLDWRVTNSGNLFRFNQIGINELSEAWTVQSCHIGGQSRLNHECEPLVSKKYTSITRKSNSQTLLAITEHQVSALKFMWELNNPCSAMVSTCDNQMALNERISLDPNQRSRELTFDPARWRSARSQWTETLICLVLLDSIYNSVLPSKRKWNYEHIIRRDCFIHGSNIRVRNVCNFGFIETESGPSWKLNSVFIYSQTTCIRKQYQFKSKWKTINSSLGNSISVR